MGAKMYDNGLRVSAGLPERKNQAPLPVSIPLLDNMRNTLQEIDKTDAIRRFTWYGLPEGIDGELIERIMYYRGMGMAFYCKTEDKFYFLPFALDGSIDVTGKYLKVTPVPFGGTSDDGKDQPWIEGYSFEPLYDMIVNRTPDWNDYTTKCVILKDRSSAENFAVGPRKAINKEIINLEAKIFPYMNTCLMNATGIDGVIIDGQYAASDIEKANQATEHAALNGKRWVPITQSLQLQDISAHSVGNAETFLQVMQSLDNYRLGTMGLENGGLFQKKAHMLGMEQEMAQSANGLILDDGLAQVLMSLPVGHEGVVQRVGKQATSDVVSWHRGSLGHVRLHARKLLAVSIDHMPGGVGLHGEARNHLLAVKIVFIQPQDEGGAVREGEAALLAAAVGEGFERLIVAAVAVLVPSAHGGEYGAEPAGRQRHTGKRGGKYDCRNQRGAEARPAHLFLICHFIHLSFCLFNQRLGRVHAVKRFVVSFLQHLHFLLPLRQQSFQLLSSTRQPRAD